MLSYVFDKLSLNAVGKGFASPADWGFKPYVLQIKHAVIGKAVRDPIDVHAIHIAFAAAEDAASKVEK
eukprot:8708450-Karenia_brevis.AAC.1